MIHFEVIDPKMGHVRGSISNMSTDNSEYEVSKNLWNDGTDMHGLFVSFAISSEKKFLFDFTDTFHVKPTWSSEEGKTYLYKTGPRKSARSVWGIASKDHILNDEIDDHLEFILKILEPHCDFIERLSKDPDLYISFRIWVQPEGGILGFGIGFQMLERIIRFGTDINFTFIGVER